MVVRPVLHRVKIGKAKKPAVLTYHKLSVVVIVLYDSLHKARQHGKKVGEVIHIMRINIVTNPETFKNHLKK